MTAVLVAGIVGGPVSGVVLSLNGVAGLAGWQWLFLLEGLPAVGLGLFVLAFLTERPEEADWLSPEERVALIACLAQESAAELVALDDALKSLAALDPRKCQVVELRFFGGMSVEESAEVLGVSVVTVMRDWSTAKAWLHRAMEKEVSEEG